MNCLYPQIRSSKSASKDNVIHDQTMLYEAYVVKYTSLKIRDGFLATLVIYGASL